MSQSYTRQSTFADGDTITAALFNNEFNQLLNAFSYSSSSASSTGHRHDGTAGEGGNIHTIGDLDFLNKVVVDGSNNRIGFFVEVSSAAVEQIRVQDGAIVPVTDNDIDLGTSSLEFKDLFLDGTATVDALVADTADINGGTIDGATIGATSASTGAFTTLSASAAVTLSSTLSVQGNTTLGNAASDTVTVTADIASDLIPSADSTHSLGDSSNYWSNAFIDAITTTGNVSVGGNLTVTGTTTFNGGTLTLGDASDDNVVFGADVNSSIIPNTDDTYDLGSSSQEWRDLYVDGTAYLDSINFNGTAISATAAELNILDGVTATTAELNILDGVTSTTAELNILDGVTSTASELNLVDGSSAGTVVNSKAVIYGSSGEVKGTTFQTATNTSGNLLIANGTGFASTAVGDLSEISSIANDDVFLAVDTSGGGLKRVTRNTIVSGLAAGTMTDVVDDTTPQLGGDLDVNGNALVSTSNGNIALTPNGTGVVRLDGNVDVQSGEIVLKNSGSVSNVKFYCESGNAHYTQLQSAAHSDYSGNVTLTLPPATDTLVGKATTDTLTNKTLTSPDINTPDIDGGTIDSTVIGGSTAAAGSFTTLSASSTFTLGGTAITSTAAELNILDGVTATAAELNLLDGVTATTTELNYVDGVTSAIQTQLDAKAPTASPTFTGLVTVNGTDAVKVPAGTTGQRPTAAQGQIRFNTTTSGFEGYNGTAWSSLGAQFSYTRTNFTATSSQTTFSVSYDVGYVDIFMNGVKLIVGTDVTATNGTSIVLASGAASGDLIEVIAYETFAVANALIGANNLSDVSSASTALTNLGLTATAAELNIMDGVTSTAAELNILDGVTSTAAELNILDGVTATTAELNILDGVTSTASELNILDGVTATATELNLLDGVTATTAELNYTDGVTSNIQTQLDAKQALDSNLTSFVSAFTLPTSDGTNGQVLTTNGSGTLSLADAGGGAWNFINSTTVSSTVASIDITSGIGSTYDFYVLQLVKVQVVNTGSGSQMKLRTSTNGGSSFDSSGYSYVAGRIRDNSVTFGGDNSDSASEIYISSGMGATDGNNVSGFIYLVKPSDAANFYMFWDLAALTFPTSQFQRYMGGGQRETAADVDAIQIFHSNNINGGTVRLFGISNS